MEKANIGFKAGIIFEKLGETGYNHCRACEKAKFCG